MSKQAWTRVSSIRFQLTRSGLTRLVKEYESTANDLGFSTDGKTLHFEPHSTYGWTYRLTRKEAGVINKKSKYTSLATKGNGTLFTTKNLRNLVSDHKDLQAKYDKRQNALVKEVVAIAGASCKASTR